MNDKEIMDKIKETAEDVSVPEELQPDVIEAMLDAEAKKDHTEPLPTERSYIYNKCRCGTGADDYTGRGQRTNHYCIGR